MLIKLYNEKYSYIILTKDDYIIVQLAHDVSLMENYMLYIFKNIFWQYVIQTSKHNYNIGCILPLNTVLEGKRHSCQVG